MDEETDLIPPTSTLPPGEVERVVAVLQHAVSEIHPDLTLVLATSDANALADTLFGDEVHHPRP